MTLSDITSKITRKPKTLARIERTIELGAFVMLANGKFGTLTLIALRDYYEGEQKRAWVEGDGFTAWVTEKDIFAYRNIQ